MSLAIAGMGWITPLGSGIDPVWERLLQGDEAQAEKITEQFSNQCYSVFRVPESALTSSPRHPRLRRASMISRFAAAAELQYKTERFERRHICIRAMQHHDSHATNVLGHALARGNVRVSAAGCAVGSSLQDRTDGSQDQGPRRGFRQSGNAAAAVLCVPRRAPARPLVGSALATPCPRR